MSDNVKTFKESLRDYLTFYHEIRTPAHDFFKAEENRDADTFLLITSSPSRMGNHLLLSLLDSHPELPRIPGEDGFLSFSFFQAQYDLKQYLDQMRGPDAVDYMERLSSNLFFNKWKNICEYRQRGKMPDGCSGVNIVHRPSEVDFPGYLPPVDYAAYHDVLCSGTEDYSCFGHYLKHYTRALLYLDPAYEKSAAGPQGFISYSGMRTQVRWVLEYFDQARLITSIRSFDSYAVSHIKSRNPSGDITAEGLQEAWEHWYHKVIDYFYLKACYPDRVCLVSFDDLIQKTESVSRGICRFLGIAYSETMVTPTLFGTPVRGNASRGRSRTKTGTVYSDTRKLDANRIPAAYEHLWKSFELVKTG